MSTYSQRFRMTLVQIERHVQKCDAMWWNVCVFFTCNNNSRFVTTSFENRKWSWFSCEIILDDFEWFVAEIDRNEMKWTEQMNPRRKICLLLNHIFEKMYFFWLFMATNSCNFYVFLRQSFIRLHWIWSHCCYLLNRLSCVFDSWLVICDVMIDRIYNLHLQVRW